MVDSRGKDTADLAAPGRAWSKARSAFRYSAEAWRNPMVRDAGIIATAQYASLAFGLVTTIVAARLLGPDAYGVAALLMAYPTLVWSLLDVKTVSITTRYLSALRRGDCSDRLGSLCKLGYGVDLITALGALGMVAVTAPWVGQTLLHAGDYTWLSVVYGGSLVFVSLRGTSTAVLSAWEQFRFLAVLQLTDRGLAMIMVIALLAGGFSAEALVLGTAAAHVAGGIIMVCGSAHVLRCGGINRWWASRLESLSIFRWELARFFGWNYVLVTLTGLTTQLPVLILGRVRGVEDAGFYRLATSMVNVAGSVEGALGRVLYPHLAGICANGRVTGLQQLLLRWTVGVGLPLGSVLLLMVLVTPTLVTVALTGAYAGMVSGIQAMLLGVVVSGVFFWLFSYYYAIGRPERWTIGYALYALALLGTGWLVAPILGFPGFATVTGVAKVGFILCMVAFAWRNV